MVLLDSQDKIVHVDKSAFLVLEIFYPQFATVAPGRGDGISPSMQLCFKDMGDLAHTGKQLVTWMFL